MYKFIDKNTGLGASVNIELAQELHKPLIKKFKIRKVCSKFKDNICAGDLAETESLSSFNCGVKYLLFVIDVFIKFAWVKSLNDKKPKTVLFKHQKKLNVNQIN